MPATVNRGYLYPLTTDAAKVPDHMRRFLEQIDADMQTAVDRAEARDNLVVVHSGDGTWTITNGLGEPVPVNDLGDGLYSIGA